MNYRHAYHAGNFADCMKHALLVWLLRALARKPAAFAVLDTHAGAGSYDLEADAATRTGEWQQGIGRLLDAHPRDAHPRDAGPRDAGPRDAGPWRDAGPRDVLPITSG